MKNGCCSIADCIGKNLALDWYDIAAEWYYTKLFFNRLALSNFSVSFLKGD